MKGQRIGNIQALRALGVMFVVGRHIQVYLQRATGGRSLLGDFFVGDSGVDLFFVISGYVMVINHHERVPQAGEAARFLQKRVRRIYPLYWVYSLPALLVYVWRPRWLHRLEYGMPVHVVRSLLLWPQAGWPLLGQAWSLVYEMYFYVVFALLLCLPPRWFLRGLLFWAGAVVAGNLLLARQAAPQWSACQLAFSVLTLEFIAGTLAGLAWRFVPWRHAARAGGFCLALAALWVLFVLLPLRSPPAGWQRVLDYGLPCVALVHGAAMMEAAGIRLPRLLVVIGNWSYSIFLSHIFVVAAVCLLLPTGPALDGAAQVLLEVVLFGGVILAGALSYRFLETALLRVT